MAATPEGKVKNKVKKVLDKYKPRLYIRMNVPGGYGEPGLDFEGAILGRAVAIETKAAGKAISERQETTISKMYDAGIMVFVIEDEQGCAILDRWLAAVVRRGLGEG